MAVRLAGDREKPAHLLIHGIPSFSASVRMTVAYGARTSSVRR